MGLDAFVPCNCLEEGKLNPLPHPFDADDIYRDGEGYLCSRLLDKMQEKFANRRSDACFNKLDNTFYEWTKSPCAHENGEYCSEWVSNWSGVALFNHLVDELGGGKAYPLLNSMLPADNGGHFPSGHAKAALVELARFNKNRKGLPAGLRAEFECEGHYYTAEKIRKLLFASAKTGNDIYWY